MTSTNVAVAIRNHKWVRELPQDHIEMLAKLAEEKHFDPGDVLYYQGDPEDHLYLIVSGTVGLTLSWKANAAALRQAVIAGEEIGWCALIKESERRCTAKAMTRVQALKAPVVRYCARSATAIHRLSADETPASCDFGAAGRPPLAAPDAILTAYSPSA